MKKILFTLALPFMTLSLMKAQSVIQFNGYSRGYIENNYLPEADTSNVDQTNKGHTLVDLDFNIKPNDNIRIGATLRMRNEIGGFWGEGQLVDLRRIYMKGVAGGKLKYQFGDINLKLTPYTLHNNTGDGSVNEASAFAMTREVSEYENFNNEDFWRLQGGHMALQLGFDKGIKGLGVQAFMTRNKRITNSTIIPDRLYGGAATSVELTNNFGLSANYVSLFDIAETAYNYEENYANNVFTGGFNYKLKDTGLRLFGEAGRSTTSRDSSEVSIVNIDGNFFELGAGFESSNKKWSLQGSFRNVDDEFFSAGAHTKRINFNATPSTLPSVNASSSLRNIAILDITRDASIYNRSLAQELMTYDPRLGTATPYGQATPNRRGFSLDGKFKRDSSESITSFISIQALKEHVGEGTPNKRNFLQVAFGSDLKVGTLLNTKKLINLRIGYQYGITGRTLTTEEAASGVAPVDYATHLLDLGLDIELFKRFDFLVGTKVLVANGTEYLSDRDEFNVITGYDKVSEQSEALMAAGFRYRFNENIHLSIQGLSFTAKGTTFSYNDALTTTEDYNINQIFALFNMHF